MQSQILVPLDGSELAETVLPQAATLARATASGLTLLRVVTPLSLVEPVGGLAPSTVFYEGLEKEPAMARGYLAALAKSLQADGLFVQTKVLEGDPARVIVSYAGTNPDVKMIAMATHGRSGLTRFLLGSVAEKVLHASPVPVLLTRVSKDRARYPAHPLRNLVVPLDGSAFAEQALDVARELAATTGGKLLLVSVVPPLDAWQIAASGSLPVWVEDLEEAQGKQLDAYLSEIAKNLKASGLSVETRLTNGDPAEEILRSAERDHADLIVMATHGRSGLQQLWLGSVAIKVMHHARLPLLLVRAKEPEQSVSAQSKSVVDLAVH
jgi:nucleotide-binding universal stress UspA family protein